MNLYWRAVFATAVVLLPLAGISAQERVSSFAGSDSAVTLEPTKIHTHATVVPDSVRLHVGYQHWRGAWLGAAIGGAIGAVAGAIAGSISSCDDCSQQPSAGSGALIAGILGAGAGTAVGFLAGLATPKYAWVPRSEGVPESADSEDLDQ